MIKNRNVILGIMAASMCTYVFSGINVCAADKNGFNIENGVLKSVDENISGEIEIPSNVTEISEQLFFGNDKITKITIPGTVKKINCGAFIGCRNLVEVNIEEGVEFIGSDCFAQCDNLKKANIPSSVKEIEGNSFEYCEKLSDIEFKADSPKIGRGAFKGTLWLKKQQNDDGLSIVQSVLLDGKEASGSITVPSEVKVIQDGAFEDNKNLEKIKIENVKEIGDYTFFRCENLINVELGNSLTFIGEDAFRGCKKLSTVNIPNSVTTITANAFEEETKLTGNTDIYKKAQEDYKYKLEDSFNVWMYRYPIGWNTYDGKRFYKREDGEKQTGWMDLNGKTYYFYSNGVQASGFIDLNGAHYYLDPNGSGDEFGKMITRWKSIDGNWYYFSPQAEGDKVKGFMKTAWLNDNGNWYYFYSDGKMATGFINLNGTYYYLDESSTSNIGIMKTGWQEINGYWYYFNQKSDGGIEGVMSKGWRKIDGVWYYFYFGDGKMAADTWIDGYYVNGSGAWVK
ncbi:MAG: leucine-rich repeat protein [Clostridium sp.]